MSTPVVGVIGRLGELSDEQSRRLLQRGAEERGDGSEQSIETSVAQVIADVRAHGDAALFELAARFDNATPTTLEVPAEACGTALQQLDPDLRAALEAAAANIRQFHEAQLPTALEMEVQPGVKVGRRPEPLERVGVYVPGGRASYPSSVLMGVLPAMVAGVSEVVVCTPPGAAGRPADTVLAACALAGADRVFAVGGAGAIAALALGTTSVPRVSKVVGPGNAFVTEAKRQLNGLVAIDCPAGPSEVLVVADEAADPRLVALELVAQAEHDPRAAAVVVGVGEAVTTRVLGALTALLDQAPRSEIVREALRRAGAALTAGTLEEALCFANDYAAEHLLLMVRRPREALPAVRNAGSIFLGPGSSVVFGDYVTGANHTLPTAGLARAYSGLSTLDFVRFSTYQEVSTLAAAALAPVAERLANSEGLYAHAAAAAARAQAPSAEAANLDAPAGGTAVEQGHETGRLGAAASPVGVRLRPTYSGIELYNPGRTRIGIDLSDNTNLFDPHPSVAQALRNVRHEQVSRYPAVYADTLRREIALLHGVEPENVSTGGGLDGVIDAAVRAFCEPGARVAHPDPTFGMVSLFAQMNGVEPAAVPLTDELDIDVDALAATGAALTYVCDPNNPTGKPVPGSTLQKLIERAPGVVLVDEAYADFGGGAAPGVGGSQGFDYVGSRNALQLRTLSKAYGLAGLRVGYAIGPAVLVREIEKSRGPYKVTASAEAAAVALLRTGKAWVADVIERTTANRERLIAELVLRGLNPLPSAANFVLVPLKPEGSGAENPARALGAALRVRGVAVRVFADLPKLGPAIRVTIGPWKMLERFLAELDAARNSVTATSRDGATPAAPARVGARGGADATRRGDA